MQHRGVLRALIAASAVMAAGWPMAVWAGAWSQPKGEGLAIVKYEPVWTMHRFDLEGDRSVLAHERVDHVVSLWGEYGLTDDVTLLLKTDWQNSDDGTRSYEGLGPTELGARWQFLSKGRSAASIQASYVTDSEGRNAAWGSPGEGSQEFDVRLLAGHSFTGKKPKFVELQIAHRWRENLASEIRIEATAGMHIRDSYTVLAQVYAGEADDYEAEIGARWVTAELGAIRHWDRWSGQLGWRATVAGRKVNAGDGPIVALWRRF